MLGLANSSEEEVIQRIGGLEDELRQVEGVVEKYIARVEEDE